MKVHFLGTSAGWPLPRLGCQCPICTSTDPKDKRLRPSILINQSVLIDAGPDFYQQIRKILPISSSEVVLSEVKGTPRTVEEAVIKELASEIPNTIFLSHTHPDHYFGLWDVAKIYKKKPQVFLSTKNKKLLIKRINDFTITSLLKEAKTFESGQEIRLPKNTSEVPSLTLSITPFLVDHSTNTETFGFLVKEQTKRSLSSASQGNTSEVLRSNSSDGGGIGERTLIYIPDFRDMPNKSLKYLKNADLAILDGSNFQPAGPHRWGHMPIKESLKLAKKLKIKKVYYTHIGHGPKMAPHRQLQAKLQKAAGQNFHLAWDGLKLNI